jgi:O-antigen/teichoic acid export membrane protein
VAISALTNVSTYALGLVTGPILARALGADGRGQVAAVMAAAAVLAWLLPLGLPSAAAYWVDEIPEHTLLPTVTLFGVAVATPVCAVLWFIAPSYLSGYSASTLTWARVSLFVLPLAAGMSTALEIRRRRGAGASWNVWRSSPLVVTAAGMVLLAVLGRLNVGTALAVSFLGSLVPMLFLVTRLRAIQCPRPSWATLRKIFPYAARAAVVTGATSVTVRLDQLGLYAIAVTTASITNPLVVGVSLALFGHQRGESSAARSSLRFRRSLGATLGLSAAVAVAIGVSAPFLLRVLFGTEFVAAAPALRLLLPGAVAFNALGLLSTKLAAENRVGEVTRASLLGAALTGLGLVAVVPRYGVAGAAGLTSVAFIGQVAYLISRGALNSTSPPSGGDDAVAASSTASKLDPWTSS